MAESKKHYTDAEAREIIKKALALQKETRNDSEVPSSEGLTIEDLNAAANEIGVSQELIRRAAAELDFPPVPAARNRFVGAETEPVELRSVPVEAGEADLNKILMMIPNLAGENGAGSVAGGMLTWTTSAWVATRDSRSMNVLVSSSDGETSVRVQDRLGQLAGGVFGGLVGGVGCGAGFGVGFGVGLGVLGSAVFSILFPLGTLALSYLGARAIYRVVLNGRRQRIRDVADNIVRLLSQKPTQIEEKE
jgi:hypothetical protein